jgi:hypothetical protein
MYTLESLKKYDERFDYIHKVTEKDVEIVNKLVLGITKTRNNTPQTGDIVIFKDKYGDLYENAHIEVIRENDIEICCNPYVPFTDYDLEQNKLYTNTSGGHWTSVPKELKFIGTKKKKFKQWGHCGACGDGAISFEVDVNVWEYAE